MRALHLVVPRLAGLAGCQHARSTAPASESAGTAAPPSSSSRSTTTVPAAPVAANPASAPDDTAIRQLFADYRAAIERGDGGRAAGLLDGTTIAFYDRL